MLPCLVGSGGWSPGSLDGLAAWLVGWLAGWFVGLFVGWLFGWLAGWLVGWSFVFGCSWVRCLVGFVSCVLPLDPKCCAAEKPMVERVHGVF